jgi:hypothetical protein
VAKKLAKFGVENIGAVGTFVVREDVTESALRAVLVRELLFKCEIMICPAQEIIKLGRQWTESRWRAAMDPVSREQSSAEMVRFVNVLAKSIRPPLSLPLGLPSDDDWVVKIIAIQGKFILGMYRRQMKAISYLGKIERQFGVPATTRNWNTIQKVMQILVASPARPGQG